MVTFLEFFPWFFGSKSLGVYFENISTMLDFISFELTILRNFIEKHLCFRNKCWITKIIFICI